MFFNRIHFRMEERKNSNLFPSSRKSSQEPELHAIEFVRTSERKIRRHSSKETVPHSLHFAKWRILSLVPINTLWPSESLIWPSIETPGSRFCNRLKHIIMSYQTINIWPPRITENQEISPRMITGVLLFSYSTLMLEALNLLFAKEMPVDPAPFLGLPPCG
jgi:hypothetical protein